MLSYTMQYEQIAWVLILVLPLLVLMVLFMRFSSVVFGLDKGKKRSNNVSLIRYTFFYLLFTSQLSILFYPLFLYAICADPTLETNTKVVVLFTIESVLSIIGIYVMAKYTPVFKFPIYFLVHIIRRTKMMISDEISDNQLLDVLVLAYVGLVIYINLIISLTQELMQFIKAGFEYPNIIAELFLIGFITIVILRLVTTTEQKVKKVVTYIINTLSH